MNTSKGMKSVSLLAFLLLIMTMLPQWAYSMGSSYEECSPYDPEEVHRIAVQGLELTAKIKYEAKKDPARLKNTLTVINEIEKDLEKAKSMTQPGKRYSDDEVRYEVNEFVVKMSGLKRQYANVMGLLFQVFRESIEQTNADKRYFLNRLAEMNEISQALGDYLQELTDAARALQEECDEPSETIKRVPELKSPQALKDPIR